MQHQYDIDYFYRQIDTIKKWVLNAGAVYILAFILLDYFRLDTATAQQTFYIRLFYMVIPFTVLLVAFYGQNKLSISHQLLDYIGFLAIVAIGFGHAELVEFAANSKAFFPRIGLTIILIYAGILMILPLTLSVVSSLMIIAFACHAYINTGLPTSEIISLMFFFVAFSSCCVLMSYISAKVLLSNLKMIKIIDHQANTDDLTQLSNRRNFYQQAEQVHKQSVRENKALALLLIDLDQFKSINDYLGHNHGDEVLLGVANVLQHRCRRPFDLVARLGGDEFAMLMYDTQAEHLHETCQQIIIEIEQISQKLQMKHRQAKLGVSIGVAVNKPGVNFPMKTLTEMANKAIHQIKNSGKNEYRFFDNAQYLQVGNTSESLKTV